eukprot:gi/632952039/ref/XP_007891626.1/ PREDICTED: C-type lectin domain family 14 member A [Callorhinchus milii]
MFPLLFISLWLRTHSASGSQSGAASERFCDGQNCYAVQWGHVSFGEAADMCRRREGVLTSMRSPREADSIRRLLLSAPGAEYPLSLWIGLRKGAKTCSSPEGRLRGYAWLSGDAASNYSAWAREPPTTCTHELCVSLEVRLERQRRLGFGWSSSKCGRTRGGFVCRSRRPPPPGTCPLLRAAEGTRISYARPDPGGGGAVPPAPAPGLPRDSVAVVSCANGHSVALRCEQREAGLGWSRDSPAGLCHECGTGRGRCPHGCFDGAEGYYCHCGRGFAVDPGRAAAADTRPSAPPPPRPAGPPGATPTPTASGQDRAAPSHPNRLFVPVLIGLSVLVLLIAAVVAIFQCCFRKPGAKRQPPREAAPSSDRSSPLLQVSSTDPAARAAAGSPETRTDRSAPLPRKPTSHMLF